MSDLNQRQDLWSFQLNATVSVHISSSSFSRSAGVRLMSCQNLKILFANKKNIIATDKNVFQNVVWKKKLLSLEIWNFCRWKNPTLYKQTKTIYIISCCVISSKQKHRTALTAFLLVISVWVVNVFKVKKLRRSSLFVIDFFLFAIPQIYLRINFCYIKLLSAFRLNVWC